MTVDSDLNQLEIYILSFLYMITGIQKIQRYVDELQLEIEIEEAIWNDFIQLN